MRRLLLTGTIGLLALSPSAAQAGRGYLHQATARAAVEQFMDKWQVTFEATGAAVGPTCWRRATRVVDCSADYKNITMDDGSRTDFDERVRVTMHVGHVKAISLFFLR